MVWLEVAGPLQPVALAVTVDVLFHSGSKVTVPLAASIVFPAAKLAASSE